MAYYKASSKRALVMYTVYIDRFRKGCQNCLQFELVEGKDGLFPPVVFCPFGRADLHVCTCFAAYDFPSSKKKGW